MSYITKTVSITGTEQEFITAFVSAVTTADKHITCETDIAEQFSSDENTPEIIFDINGCFKIKVARTAALNSSSTPSYQFSAIINDTAGSNITMLMGSSVSYKANGTRTWKFIIFDSEGHISIKFYPYSTTTTASSNPSMYYIAVFDGEFKAVSSTNITPTTDFSALNFIRTDDDGKGETYKFTKRLTYPVTDGRVEIIKNKVLLKGDCLGHIFPGFYDCSTIVKDSIVTIEGANYYALDENTLAPI